MRSTKLNSRLLTTACYLLRSYFNEGPQPGGVLF